jgi:hypothetical protein
MNICISGILNSNCSQDIRIVLHMKKAENCIQDSSLPGEKNKNYDSASLRLTKIALQPVENFEHFEVKESKCRLTAVINAREETKKKVAQPVH